VTIFYNGRQQENSSILTQNVHSDDNFPAGFCIRVVTTRKASVKECSEGVQELPKGNGLALPNIISNFCGHQSDISFRNEVTNDSCYFLSVFLSFMNRGESLKVLTNPLKISGSSLYQHI
jgi:hypothetical protein